MQLAIPRVSFSPPYELQVTLERIRGQNNIDRLAVNVGSISEAIVFGEPRRATFVIDDEPRIAGTYLPNGVQPQTYYLLGLTDKARLGLQIWSDNYLRYFVNHFMIPLHPVSEFRANSQLIRVGTSGKWTPAKFWISDVRIRKMQAPSLPAIDASSEERTNTSLRSLRLNRTICCRDFTLLRWLIENPVFGRSDDSFRSHLQSGSLL